MSFRANDSSVNQTSILDATELMSEREKRFLKRSWAKVFAEEIFPQIDESPFAPMYSDKDSRPNTPVNVTVGALMLKELNGMSDDDILSSLLFDIRFRYALHTTRMSEQPMSDRTLGRFRERCITYTKETGKDPLHECMSRLSGELAKLMKIDRSLRRMDSMMIESNIKRMSRLELLYTCVSRMVKLLHKNNVEVPENLRHYLDKDDENLVIYHNKSDDTTTKIERVLSDAGILMQQCAGGNYDEYSEYQLLLRVLTEQANRQEDGSYLLKEAGDPTMHAGILQNPSDPEATFRQKAGKQHRGYVANIVEEKGENGSLITEYQFEQNTYSDSRFMQDYVEGIGRQETPVMIAADGAYNGAKLEEQAASNNVTIVNTNLTGKEARDIAADFKFNEDSTRVIECPNGKTPKSCSCSKEGTCTVSFYKKDCEHCPYRDQCNPKEYSRTMRVVLSARTKQRAEKQRERKTDNFKKISAFRNGIETVPSFLRRCFNVDQMPVRGKARMSFFLGCKIGALNVMKFCNSRLRRNQSAQMAIIG